MPSTIMSASSRAGVGVTFEVGCGGSVGSGVLVDVFIKGRCTVSSGIAVAVLLGFIVGVDVGGLAGNDVLVDVFINVGRVATDAVLVIAGFTVKVATYSGSAGGYSVICAVSTTVFGENCNC